MTDNVRKIVDGIVRTVQTLGEQGYLPMVIVGMDRDGNCIARSIDPSICDSGMTRTVLCRVVVGDIAPEALT